jgi:hypothetical protein
LSRWRPLLFKELQARVLQDTFGERGNCASACYASLLGLPLSEVPNFVLSDQGEIDERGAWQRERDWLKARGLALRTIHLWDGAMLDLVHPDPNLFCIAVGKSPRSKPGEDGFFHAVIWKGDEVVHDPHPDGTGLVGRPTQLQFVGSVT